MRRNTLGIAAATLAAAATIGVAGAAMANAADDSTASPSPSGSASTDAGRGGGPGGAHDHTAVTGAEADKVIAAVKEKDSSVTVDAVRKDPDGSYDALGTKDGSPVCFDVSADLTTVTERTGRPGGRMGHGGPGGMGQHTAVTGSEADKVEAAVKAKDSAVTVDAVRKDPDGSYDALGTKDGSRVFFEVSADVKTVTESTGGPGRHGGMRGGPADGTLPGGSGSSSTTSSDPTAANGAGSST